MTEEIFDSSAVRLEPPPIVLQPARSREPSSHRTGSRSPVRLPPYLGPQPTVEVILADDNLSYAQKQLAARIDRAATRIRIWCEQLENWKWTGSFAPHLDNDGKAVGVVLDARDRKETKKNKQVNQWGSLPAAVVEEYENHLDAIHDELVTFDLDDLKERVLDITHSNSRPSSSSSTWTMSSVTYVDDYSYFVTRTLILALPQLTLLNRYLKTWNVRLAVLRMVPAYLASLAECQRRMVNIWTELDHGVDVNDDSIDQEQRRLDNIRESCESHIFNTSRILDTMLDTLEGHDDVLPDSWIDDFEVLETDMSNWSVSVQNKMLELRLAGRPSLTIEDAPEESIKDVLKEESGEPDEDAREVVSNGNSEKDSLQILTTPSETEGPQTSQDLGIVNDREAKLPSTTQVPSSSVTALSEAVPDPSTPLKEAAEPSKTPTHSVETKSSPISEALIPELIASEKDIDVLEHSSPANSSPITQLPISEIAPPPAALPLVEVSRRDASQSSDPSSSIDSSVIHHDPEGSEYDFEDDFSVLEELSNIYEITDDEDDNDSIYGRELEESPSQRKQPISRLPKPPLNSMMRKRQDKASLPIINTPTGQATPRKLKKLNIKNSNSKDSELLSPVSPVLPLEQQISNILDTIPTPIRLKTGPSANAPYIKSSRPLRSPTPTSLRRTISSQNALANSNNTPPTRLTIHNSGSTPTLTLAPADEPTHLRGGKHSHATGHSTTNSASSRRIHDPDVQLYHLIQTGRTHPIKLFIRRVGENGERVMVRVGGGWADLAEYLRVFAQHHGRRAVSDGGSTVEVLALGNAGGAESSGRVTGGRSTPTPGENVQVRRSSTASNSAMSGSPLVTTVITDNPDTPPHNPNSSRRPSIGQDPGSASSLAGPFARRMTGDISDEKQEWVDGIVEQAKRSLGKDAEVGDLGKRGATRRVFIRKGTGTFGEKE